MSQLSRFSKEAQVEGGLPRFQSHFSQKNVKDAMEVMLEPEEFASFYKLNDYLGKAFSIQKSNSPTQPFFQMGVELANEVPKGLTRGAIEAGLSTQRFLRNVVTLNMGDDIAKNIALRQNEAYQNQLADYLVSGKPIEELINVFDSYGYAQAQTGIRSIDEGVDAISSDDDVSFKTERQKEEIEQQLKGLQNQQSLNLSPQMDVPIFQSTSETVDSTDLSPVEVVSPTILPDERDREIAMRRQAGIAGLV